VLRVCPPDHFFELVSRVCGRCSRQEAAYKALDPFLCRFVGWQEVEALPCVAGTAALRFLGNNTSGTSNTSSTSRSIISSDLSGSVDHEPCGEPRLGLVGQWRLVGDFIVTAIGARKKSVSTPTEAAAEQTRREFH
jgi:hypothetical protein